MGTSYGGPINLGQHSGMRHLPRTSLGHMWPAFEIPDTFSGSGRAGFLVPHSCFGHVRAAQPVPEASSGSTGAARPPSATYSHAYQYQYQ
ncbi:hypothetical protein PENSPDRAFT_659733 [Peniophora sp. CONT]|nr:hypothetical protein PENSPDRAFT_659783 [Peniophora sp. CONT]KZV60175.1 hypothetical protein PENSPDRAFT_659733 [Peniophora sp. CONT]